MAGIEGNITTDFGIHSVTEMTDVTNAGSGAIITATERTKLSNLEPYGGKVSRPDADTVRIGTKEKTNSIVVVNNEEIDVSGNIDCAVGAAPNDLIEGGAPAATTQYYVYLQNTAAGGPRLRLSATVPTNAGYRTGDANSRLVGTVYLDGAKQVASDQELAGIYQKDVFTAYLTSNLDRAAGGGGFYTALDFGHLVYLPNSQLFIIAQQQSLYTVNPGSNPDRYCSLFEDATKITQSADQQVPWNASKTFDAAASLSKTAVGRNNYEIQYYYVGAGTHRLLGDATILYTYLVINRISL